MNKVAPRVIGFFLCINALLIPFGITSAQVPVDRFVIFESAHDLLLEMRPDGNELLPVNTANNTKEVFNIESGGAQQNGASIPDGHDPVTVSAWNNT